MWKVTFHIVITQRIYPILERLSAFSPSQAGFRTGKSTGQLIRTLLDVLSDARESGQELHGAFLDLVKAYDCVPWVILGQSLRRFGVPEKLVSFITNAYQGSSATVLTGLGPSPDFSIHNGLRQGCTGSPVLFLIWIQPLLDWLESQSLGYTMSKSELKSPYCSEDVSVSILAFADDLKLFAPSDSNLQALLSCVNSFLEDSCMKVNPSKSAAYSLNSKSTQVPHCSSAPLPILQPKDSYCYLGVWVNPKGDSDFHIKQLLHKTKERLLKIQRVDKGC